MGKKGNCQKLHGEPPYLTNRICHIESWVLNPVSVKDLSALFLSEKAYSLLLRNHSSKSFSWSCSFKPFKTSPKEHLTRKMRFTPPSTSCPLAQHLEHNEIPLFPGQWRQLSPFLPGQPCLLQDQLGGESQHSPTCHHHSLCRAHTTSVNPSNPTAKLDWRSDNTGLARMSKADPEVIPLQSRQSPFWVYAGRVVLEIGWSHLVK